MMTDTPELPKSPGTRAVNFFRLTPDYAQALRHIPEMHAAAWRLWSYLVTFDPFGDNYQELPPLVDILTECNISKPTFYRAIALFAEHELFDLQPTKMYVLNLRGEGIVSPVRQEVSPMRKQSHTRDPQSHGRENAKNKKPDKSRVSGDRACTNNRSTDCSEKQNSVLGIDRDGIGTDFDHLRQLIEAVQKAGLNPNKTIETALAQAIAQDGPAAARSVENALSAVEEQREKGTVRNPGGMFVAALRRGFTANEAKREARARRGSSPPKPPDPIETALGIDLALQRGDRAFAHTRLQQLIKEGWLDLVEELLCFHKDWEFHVTTGSNSTAEVRDAQQR